MAEKEMFNSLLLLEGITTDKMEQIVDRLGDFCAAMGRGLGKYDIIMTKRVVGHEERELSIVYYGDVLTIREYAGNEATKHSVKLGVEEFQSFLLM